MLGRMRPSPGAGLLAVQPSALRCKAAAFKPSGPSGRTQRQRAQAQPKDDGGRRGNVADDLKQKYFSQPPQTSTSQQAAQQNQQDPQGLQPQEQPTIRQQRRRRRQERAGAPIDGSQADVPATPAPTLQASTPVSALDAVNPLALGRKARKTVDALWDRLSSLSSPTKSFVFDEEVEDPYQSSDFSSLAASTTVLVVGATGRVGRILMRKLLLRGYMVKALVRRREGKREVTTKEGEAEGIPEAVEVVEGDVGSMDACQEAVRGVNKIIFCAAARSLMTTDLFRVEERGVGNVVKALQDEFTRRSKRSRNAEPDRSKREVADFAKQYHQARWDLTYIGVPEEDRAAASRAAAAGATAKEEVAAAVRQARANAAAARGANSALAEINEENMLIFEGQLLQRGAMAEVGASISQLLPRGEHRLKGTEGLVIRMRGDGQAYVCILRNAEGLRYGARFQTRKGYFNVRLPFSAFRAEAPSHPPFDPEHLASMAIRFENRRSALATAAKMARGLVASLDDDGRGAAQGKFELHVDWIKALPGGIEPDMVLVSCAGQPREGVDEASLTKMVEAKRRGEELLRLSGLGYTIIRPGTLVEEPGGYRALVFDQGDRITQSISAADVADICLRALHEPAARSKTFDVCYEYKEDSAGAEDQGTYELIAHVPDNRNNYLRAAVSSLLKNT